MLKSETSLKLKMVCSMSQFLITFLRELAEGLLKFNFAKCPMIGDLVLALKYKSSRYEFTSIFWFLLCSFCKYLSGLCLSGLNDGN